MRKVGMGIGRTKAHRTFLKLRSSAAAGLHTMPSRYPSKHSGSRPTDLGWNRDAQTSQLLLRAAMAIAKADSEFSTEEQKAIARLCEALGTESVDLDLD